MEQEQINLLHRDTNQGIQQLQRDNNMQLTNKQKGYPSLMQSQEGTKNTDKISLNKDIFVQTNKRSIQGDLFDNKLINQSQQSNPIYNNQIFINKTVQYSAHQNTIKIKPYINQQEHFGNSHTNNYLPYQVSSPLQNYQNSSINKNTPAGYFSNNNNINTVNTMQLIQPQIKSYYPSSSNSFHNYSQVKPYVFSQPIFSSPAQPITFNQQQPIDQQYEKPLMNKVRNKFPHKQNKNISLISQDQIKRGFNNSLQIALQKVNKKQQQQQQQVNKQLSQKPIKNHQIQIISNLVHETYSPSKQSQHINSSEKKGKKRIFEDSQRSRDKTRSLYEQSIVSFGTPQSMKFNKNLKNSVFDYEMKTQRQEEREVQNKIVVKQNNQVVYNEQQKQIQIPDQIVPKQILKAWQKLKDKH